MPRPVYSKKHLGQNFLANAAVTEKILAGADLHPEDIVVEIGPGKGALTRHLPQHVSAVYAVEKDRRLADRLREDLTFENLHIITKDFLKLDLTEWGDRLKILGNIPYNLSTPIVERLIECRARITGAFLTVQKEFAARLTAAPGTKDYGTLSCYLQYYAEITPLFDIHPQNFRPAPKVFSTFIKIRFRPPEHPAVNEQRLFKLIRHVFTQRRKKIANTLGGLVPRDRLTAVLNRCGIKETLRPDQITVAEYVRLINALEEPKGEKAG